MQQNTVTNKLARLIVIVMLTITITSVYAHASIKNNAGLPGWVEVSGGYQVSASFLLNPIASPTSGKGLLAVVC